MLDLARTSLAHFAKCSQQLTPWELHDNIHFKRDDQFAPLGYGTVNGSKLRAAAHIFSLRGNATRILTAASGLSPQHAIVGYLSFLHGLPHTHISAADPAKYPSLQIAKLFGGEFIKTKVGYQPALNKAVNDLHALTPGSYVLPYGLTVHSPHQYEAFYQVNAPQTHNIPPQVKTLFAPAGSCNTLISIIKGLAQSSHNVETLISLGVGPNKVEWTKERLHQMGIDANALPFKWNHDISLHDQGYASYGDKMPERVDDIELHPTYEGKLWRYLKQYDLLRHDGSEAFWIVGSAPNPTALQKYF